MVSTFSNNLTVNNIKANFKNTVLRNGYAIDLIYDCIEIGLNVKNLLSKTLTSQQGTIAPGHLY